ncbi:hypothetical protein ACJO11_17085 [Vibrio parahaemolyticus]|uniref:hypothetical protein n=1 Tax=Vibrio parahaemolyticus TaxID=670 RepID=UPI002153566E|nr:hypothetical protein [Vibrio parahaemolyticus]MCZ5937962.1 hypothetical protein [Vibrio parahaemolyticus]
MSIKMKAVSAEAAARHPGCAGIEPHAFEDKEAKTTMRCDWFWPLKAVVKLVLFVVLLFALPSPISFLIILLTASFWLNKLHRRYGRRRASIGRARRFQGHGLISMGAGSASGLSCSGVYQAGLVGAASAELISDTTDFISDSSSSFWCGDINPASGLPMIDNSCIDVGGNVFGDDSMTSIDSGFDCGGISCDPFDSTI